MITQQLLVTPPAVPVVTLTEAKNFLRVDDTTDDLRIEALIEAATTRIEEEIDRKLIDQTWSIFFDNFPNQMTNDWWDGTKDGSIKELYTPIKYIKLPFGVMRSVTQVSSFDNDDVEYVFPATEYQADTVGPFGRIGLRLGAVWPATVLRPVNGVKITAVFGFGSTAAAVPQMIKTAILELTSSLYEYRGDEFPKIPATAMVMIQPYRRHRLG